MPVVVPIAVTAGDATNAQVGVEWTLDGSGSYDPDGRDITSYQWTLAAKPPDSSATITLPNSVSAKFTPDVAGTYRFFLVVGVAGNVTSESNQGKAPSSAFSNISVPTSKGFIIPARGQREWHDHLHNTFKTVDAFVDEIPAEYLQEGDDILRLAGDGASGEVVLVQNENLEIRRLQHDDLSGGYQAVADITERDNMPSERRREGMRVKVLDENKNYDLIGGTDNEHWTEVEFGAEVGGPRVWVFQPAATDPAGNIYNDWGELYADFNAAGSNISREVVIDPYGLDHQTFEFPEIPNGVYDFTNAKLSDGGVRSYSYPVLQVTQQQQTLKLFTGQGVPLNMQPNAQFTNLYAIEGITFFGKDSGIPSIQWAPGDTKTFYLNTVFFAGTQTSTVPIVQVTGTNTVVAGLFVLSQAVSIGGPVFDIQAPAQLNFSLRLDSAVNKDTVTGQAGSTWGVSMDATSEFDGDDIGQDFPDFLGTYNGIDLVSDDKYIDVSASLSHSNSQDLRSVLEDLDNAISQAGGGLSTVLANDNTADEGQEMYINNIRGTDGDSGQDGAHLHIRAGQGGAGDQDGGNLQLNGGPASGSGAHGEVQLGANNTSLVRIETNLQVDNPSKFVREIGIGRQGSSPGNEDEIWASDGGNQWWDRHLYWTRTSGDHDDLIRPPAAFTEFSCHSSVTAGDLVYMDNTGTIQRAIASSMGTSLVLGICYEKKGSTTCYVATHGVAECSGAGAGNDGERRWLSASNPGEATDVAPSTIGHIVAPVGIMVGNGRLSLQIWPQVEITT